jgi:hypothetical protein
MLHTYTYNDIMFQAGGHQLIKRSPNDYNILFKPTKYKEVLFYENINNLDDDDTSTVSYSLDQYDDYELYLQDTLKIASRISLFNLKKFIPTYYGYGLIKDISHMYTLEEIKNMEQNDYIYYVKLGCILSKDEENNENILILDIKLGSIHYESTTSYDDIQERSKRNENSIMNECQFRIDGFIHGKTLKSKEQCRNMTLEEVINIFKNIKNISLLLKWLNKLENTLKYLSLSIYGPSILIIQTNDRIHIRLIDFAVHELSGEKNIDLLNAICSVRKYILYAENRYLTIPIHTTQP